MTHSPAARLADLSSLRVLSCGGCPLAPPPGDGRRGALRLRVFSQLRHDRVLRKNRRVDALRRDATRRQSRRTTRSRATSGRPFSLVDVRVTHPTAGREVFAAAPGDGASAAGWRRGVAERFSARDLRAPTRTKSARDEDGWFNAGDLATVRTDGYVVLVDRKKDMILVGGENGPVPRWKLEVVAQRGGAGGGARRVASRHGRNRPGGGDGSARTPRSTKLTRRPSSDTVVDRSRGTSSQLEGHGANSLRERQRVGSSSASSKTRRGRRAHQTRRLREWRRRRTRRRRRGAAASRTIPRPSRGVTPSRRTPRLDDEAIRRGSSAWWTTRTLSAPTFFAASTFAGAR